LEEPVLLSHVLQQVFQFTPEATPVGGLWWWTFALAQNLPETLIKGHEREFLTYFYSTYCHDPSAIAPDVINEYMRSFAAPKGVSGALGVYRAVFESIAQTEPLAQNKLKIPVLALGGDRSLGDHVKMMLQNVALDVRGGAIEQCGHFVADERPDYLAKQLIAFFHDVQYPTALRS
ncbi:MAG: alpha/beta hydrolase, partial [Chroococcidiopsidaceae cyanobacterium CP_BM_RX_35]|nr:alpha/beta hydrolase [Chroococcidiopsidaceae cyanobacterium CP_BM_RX_35]